MSLRQYVNEFGVNCLGLTLMNEDLSDLYSMEDSDVECYISSLIKTANIAKVIHSIDHSRLLSTMIGDQ